MGDYCLKRLLFLSLLFITPSFISGHEQEQPKRQNDPFGGTTRFLLELGEDEDHHPTITTKKIKPISNPSPNLIKSEDEDHHPRIITKKIKPISNPSPNLIKSEDEDHHPTITTKKIKAISNLIKSTTNHTPTTSKNQTKPISELIKSTTNHTPTTSKNQTKPIKIPSSSSPPNTNQTQSHLKKLNPTSDLPKHTTSAQLEKKPSKAQQKPNSIEEDDDLVSGFRDLPSKFQETIVPDFTAMSKTSKVYLNRYNREFTRGFKPYVGSKYASTFASYALFAFILIPLIIVSLVFNRIKAYFSIQKILIFIQIYLAIYFSILGLSCLATGLEPLRFFYSTSRSTYLCVQVLQTLGYVLYLLLLLMYLILVFSTETGLAPKMLGLGQTFVGFAVGLHYYMTVFHRAVLDQPPKSSWKVHGLYATCFVVICLLGGVETRKKAYLEEGGEEGKKS